MSTSQPSPAIAAALLSLLHARLPGCSLLAVEGTMEGTVTVATTFGRQSIGYQATLEATPFGELPRVELTRQRQVAGVPQVYPGQPRYFIHSWLETGSRYLCSYEDSEVLVHGELDIASGTWHASGEVGVGYGPHPARRRFSEAGRRFSIEELNTGLTLEEFAHFLALILSRIDPDDPADSQEVAALRAVVAGGDLTATGRALQAAERAALKAMDW